MKKLKLYLTGALIIAVLICIIGVLCYVIKRQHEQINRSEQNIENLRNEVKGQNSYLQLTVREFKKSMPNVIDSTLKASGIRTNEVQDITYVHNHYYDIDTTIIRPPEVIEEKDTIYPFNNTEDCFTVAGYMKVVSRRPELTITQRRYDDSTMVTAHQKREKKFWFIRWGKKNTYIESSSRCGETTVQRIDIIKK